jgi:uroporphyrinogen decarboxylase
MNALERFRACLEYQPTDQRPNHELGVWEQTKARWTDEAPDAVRDFGWNWFYREDALGLDHRDYVDIDYGFIPRYEEAVLEDDGETRLIRDSNGIVRRTLMVGAIGGASMSMDEYVDFPVKEPSDFEDIKKRLIASDPARMPADLQSRKMAWSERDYPLVLGRNCAANGFYWRAREWMGTENLSYAWYDEPDMMHEMMEFFADFIIETSRPVLDQVQVDFFTLNEDLSMKGGPLIGPDTYKTFILPHLKRLVAFLHSYGIRYVGIDSDGDPTVLIPMFLEAGVNLIWPIERASDVSPVGWRSMFGRDLRLSGGVDKRVLMKGPRAVRRHLVELIPLVEEGGYIPSIDHTVPPDISWDQFRDYMDAKQALLAGDFAQLG